MSIPVDLADLERTLAEAGPGYLLTTAEGRVRAVSAEPVLTDGVLVVADAGRRTCANIAANPAVTLLFAPREERGYSLLVDGTATVEDGTARVRPLEAVLHRPRRHADGPGSPESAGDCGADRRPR